MSGCPHRSILPGPGRDICERCGEEVDREQPTDCETARRYIAQLRRELAARREAVESA